jgi:hypothetical protein
MATMLMTINPNKYKTYIVYESNRPLLYGKLNKCLYGTLRAAMLFWTKLKGLLLEWGFEPSACDPCVLNKMVNGKQITVRWHDDDLKISCVLKDAIDELLLHFNRVFGTEAPLTAQYGYVYEYL